MARFTRWVSSERVLFPLLAVGLAFGAPVHADRWRHGVFPIAEFEGYTSHFGQRRGAARRWRPHTGLDIAAPLGSPVLNWWSGRVVETVHDSSCGVGVVVVSGGYEHTYCHLQKQVLRKGQVVNTGQLIGRVGMTGLTTGPHLHWGIRFENQWLDPADILRAMIRSRRATGTAGP